MGDFANMHEAASILASYHYLYSKDFIAYLQTVASNIDDTHISKPILENIDQESGIKHYVLNNASMCNERVKMYDKCDDIEKKQNYNAGSIVDVDVDSAVKEAQKQTISHNLLNDPQWTLMDKMTLCSRILAKQGDGETLSGQITCRTDKDDTFLVNSYGLPLELVSNDDFLEIDGDLNVMDGEGFANKATRFHIHIYRKRPDIKCIIHTHPPYSSALSMSGYKLFISHMDTMAFYDDVQYLPSWPGIPFGDDEGDVVSAVLSDKYWAALLAHHGIIIGGSSIEEATYRAYFFEEAAKMQINALSAVGGDINKLKKTNPELSVNARDWRISEGPVNAHFNGWAQIILKSNQSPF